MADEPPTLDEGAVPTVDPFEAELVAYLDGELEPGAARKVEARLAADPAARARAAALKKTFDLLDYLPKREPSATFASRTLDRLPAAKSGPTPNQRPAEVHATQAAPVQGPTPSTPAASTPGQAVPVSLSGGSVPVMMAAPPARWGLWAAGLLLAVGACLAGGYFAAGLARTHLLPSARDSRDELNIADHRVVENLYLYAAVDDLDFVRELGKPDLFGDDPTVAVDPILKPPAVETDKPTGTAFDRLASEFKALPPARRQAIRDLDKQLLAQEAPTRDILFRVLETYALWLDRLPAPVRSRVLAQESAARRLEEVRNIRNQQWYDALPSAQKAKLKGLPPDKQADLIRQWKDDEAARRDDWAFQKVHADDIAANKVPWPFDTAERRKEVTEFMRATYRLDDEKQSRVNDTERSRYNTALAAANERGGWMAWYAYGRTVYEMAKRYEVLPEPAAGPPVTTYAQLGVRAEKWFDKGKGRAVTLTSVGKWPEFALAVHNYASTEKGDKIPLPPLGPCRPSEFKEPLRTFVVKDLLPGLSPADRKALESAEGKWPEYPRELVRLARQADVTVPGVTLPGSPKRWDSLYGFGPRLRP